MLVAVAALAAGLSLIRAAIDAHLLAAPSGRTVLVLAAVAPAALFLAFAALARATNRLVETRFSIVRNWALSSGGLVLFLAYLLPLKIPVALHLARAVGAILLIAGVLIADRKLRRWQAAPVPAITVLPGVAAGPQTDPVGRYGAAGMPALGDRDRPEQAQPQRPRPQVSGTQMSMEPEPTDWDASLWDPDVQQDIEHRRRRGGPTG
ncbi:hypothetical protein ACFFHU_11850 [Plantactinospora siamensis]|uniref:Uncharacterized protein n=1 Tax=Plantactinospora siamensis TaxID=555372 RepID=A0ABV6NVL3_9ACTN